MQVEKIYDFSRLFMSEYKILRHIKSPKDLDKLSFADLEALCIEIRKKIIQTVSCNGGHLASNLGVVEIAVVLHKAFDSPNDKIIWDVGHQCYAHKLLTGRFNIFDTIREQFQNTFWHFAQNQSQQDICNWRFCPCLKPSILLL